MPVGRQRNQKVSNEVEPKARPKRIYELADAAWKKTMAKELEDGKGYAVAARKAQQSYDRVLRQYDRNFRYR